jgi:hypothetical protein
MAQEYSSLRTTNGAGGTDVQVVLDGDNGTAHDPRIPYAEEYSQDDDDLQ